MVKSYTVVDRKLLAYVIGIALGDGNLSNPNGRATRLRITCDLRYPVLLQRMASCIQKLLPENKISIVKRPGNCVDISCYSNRWEQWLGWKAGFGSKHHQSAAIPKWISRNKKYSLMCLKGLIETDGSIYRDRGYLMVNYVTIVPALAYGVMEIIRKVGFVPRLYILSGQHKTKYTIRLSRNVSAFLNALELNKKS